MGSTFNQRIRDGRLPLALLILGIGAGTLHWQRACGLLFSLGLIALVLRGALRPCLSLVSKARREVNTTWAGIKHRVDGLRAPTPMPAWLELAWYVLIFLWIILFLLPGLTGSQIGVDSVASGLSWIMMGLGVVEWTLQASRLFRRAWARLAGKMVWAALTALFFCIAGAWARELTFALTHEDPAAFPSFVGFVTVSLVPLVWWAFVCTIGAMWAGLKAMSALLVLLWRLKDTPPNNAPGELIRVFRPASALMVVAWLALPAVAPKIVPGTTIYHGVIFVLRGLDYWPRLICGASRPLPTVKLEDGRYSIMTPEGPSSVSCPIQNASGEADRRPLARNR